jgi:hypothetical protein
VAWSIVESVHWAVGLPGSVELITSSPATPTHSLPEGHDTSAQLFCTGVCGLHEGPPAAGSMDLKIPYAPVALPATHSERDGHAKPDSDRGLEPVTRLTFHANRPPLGSVDVTTFPN